jgi:hypothetical protein
MTEISVNTALVARCGLYCGACKSYLSGKCAGCHENARATWCGVRSCCAQKQIATCAECVDFPDPRACRKFNNFMSKLFAVVYRSDRAACITQIKDIGLEGHAKVMAQSGRQTIRR